VQGQISFSRYPVCINLLQAAVIHATAENRAEHQPNPGLSLAPFTDNQQHFLRLRCGNQAIADLLLQCRDVLWIQQLSILIAGNSQLWSSRPLIS